ncbi:MAG: Amuc_1102 family pilus-like protein [Chthoniobacterales bacterium]
MKTPLLVLTLAAVAVTQVFAQQPQTGIEITKIEPTFEKTPVYNIGIGPKRNTGASKDWLIVEVEFSYEPRGASEPQFLDDLVFNYYIALNNKSAKNPQPTLITGSVTHVAIPKGKELRSSAFVSPRTLERFFDGKVPANAAQAVAAVGITITRGGQVVAEMSTGEGKGIQQWWTRFQQAPPGYVLNKNETPFAPLFGDYYEAIRAKPPGL